MSLLFTFQKNWFDCILLTLLFIPTLFLSYTRSSKDISSPEKQQNLSLSLFQLTKQKQVFKSIVLWKGPSLHIAHFGILSGG
ncbi:hypothetical protein EUGRSUZ_C00612 [Eucalyptus grandis]|uniref:Uncharacterized protein n=2 Tax=Eucalyptus grandis TaxID=71139 RepID=A0ACC3LBJ7_EUCGR|nr:hypothetical protein EUGRSUZ_C00612 [Eucalyptus grandis]